MRTSEFDYQLPDELIAQHPPQNRSGGRLLCLGDDLQHHSITELPELLRAGDLVVMNDTRVYPARLSAKKSTGGKLELLVENILDERRALCLCKSSKSPKPNTDIVLETGHTAVVTGRQNDLFEISFTLDVPLLDYLQEYGSLPLPPYIERSVDADDRDRYQTVYACNTGAVAAPTAGLHFDDALIERCRNKEIEFDFLTLHVGAGTFQPVRGDSLEDHIMHAEWLNVSQSLCDKIQETKDSGGRVIAIGTTVVRALETAASQGELKPYVGDTRLFIKPGDSFSVVDGLLTNFHLPRSTLLMLVCAFAGKSRMLNAYNIAVDEKYRFFSYGDAMLVWPDGRDV